MAQEWARGGQFRRAVYVKNGENYSMRLNFTPIFEKLQKAQIKLDARVWQDVQKYMPVGATGQLKEQTAALNAQSLGTGKVYLYPDTLSYGHYQHEGIVYVDPVYGYAAFPIFDENGVFLGLRSRFGVEKVPSDRKLHYSQPKAQAHWGERAIQTYHKEWEKLVLKELR